MSVAIAPTLALDGLQLAETLRAGIYRLFSRTDHLNKINVFPVPDGDTGTNMAMTLAAVLGTFKPQPESHAGRLLVRVADAAIDGARGNSGAILAQFLLGLADRAGHLAELTTRDFAAAAEGGAIYARESLTEPREGTLLTVLTDFAREAQRLAGSEAIRNFQDFLRRGLARAQVSLADTRGRLEALRAANVVDAGAQGFVDMLEGMSGYLDTGEVGEAVVPHEASGEAMSVGGSAGEHRYCTECLITGDNIDRRHLREALSALGGSLVVAGTQRKARVHLHTNEPEKAFDVAAQHGVVSGQKADDMQVQARAAHHAAGQSVVIVSDSAADLPDEVLEQLEVHIVPLRVHFGARSFLDKVSLSPEEFYRELGTNPEHPKTSQPPPGDFRRMYEFLASHYDRVISIALTARVSGTCNAARTAAEKVAGGKVTVIDSGSVSLGQGLIAMYAAECAQAGWSADEVEKAVRAVIPRTTVLGLLAGLDHAVRGGRVPAFVRTLSRLLRLSPILTSHPDGSISPGPVMFGRGDLRARFALLVRRRLAADKRYRIAVGHGNVPEQGARLLAEITSGLPNIVSSHVMPLGTALGVHGGPGMLVVGFQEYEPPARRPGPTPT